MKRNLLFAFSLAAGLAAQATDVKLIVQQIDNHGAVAGNTYRVYAQLPSAQHSLQVVYGDAAHPLNIQSSAGFYQSPIAGFSAAGISQAAEQADAGVRYDSWITVGYTNNDSNDMWDIGVDFAGFDQGGQISTTNGGWFLVPTDTKCAPNAQGLVLIGQFTSTGIVQGTLNLQGKTPNGEIWRANDVRFITKQSETFGCTDRASSNYNAQATFNDGSCNGQTPAITSATEAGSWDVFPNPLRSNVLNIQLNSISVKAGARVQIYDVQGKLTATHTIGKDTMISGNRIAINQSLTAGTYQVVFLQDGMKEAKTIIVQ